VLATVGEACIETRGPRLPRARVALLAVVGPLTLLALAGMFAVPSRSSPTATPAERCFSFGVRSS